MPEYIDGPPNVFINFNFDRGMIVIQDAKYSLILQRIVAGDVTVTVCKLNNSKSNYDSLFEIEVTIKDAEPGDNLLPIPFTNYELIGDIFESIRLAFEMKQIPKSASEHISYVLSHLGGPILGGVIPERVEIT